MKVRFLNATSRKGVSEKGKGTPYDLCKLNYLLPVEAVDKDYMTYFGFGMVPVEIDLDPRCIHQFGGINAGDEVDIKIEPNPAQLRFNWVCGVAPSVSVAQSTNDKKGLGI